MAAVSGELRLAQSERLAARVRKEQLDRQLTELQQRQERLADIGEMTARFAHQVRTPLASAMLYTAQLDRNSEQQQRVVRKLTARLNDLGRMVNDMLGFAAGTRQTTEPVGVYDLLTDVQIALETQLRGADDLRVLVEDATLRVVANRDALKGAVLNLVTNAIQACDAQATIVIAARAERDGVVISVSDNGPGIPDNVLPRLFEPFFTTRPQGTGLGLAVVQSMARTHGGDVTVATSKLGTCFSIWLPTPPSPEEGSDA